MRRTAAAAAKLQTLNPKPLAWASLRRTVARQLNPNPKPQTLDPKTTRLGLHAANGGGGGGEAGQHPPPDGVLRRRGLGAGIHSQLLLGRLGSGFWGFGV